MSRIYYVPEKTVNAFLAEEHLRAEEDKRIVREYQQRLADQRSYRLHSFTLPWIFTVVGMALAGLCFLWKWTHTPVSQEHLGLARMDSRTAIVQCEDERKPELIYDQNSYTRATLRCLDQGEEREEFPQ